MRNKLLSLFIVLVLSLSSVCVPLIAYADPTSDSSSESQDYDPNDGEVIRSIKKDLFMSTLIKKISWGDSITDSLREEASGDDYKNRKEINFEILKGTDKSYSLYDRFGPNISFPLYTGEEPVKTNAADKIYTYVVDVQEKELSFESIADFFLRGDTNYNNMFYSSRPPLKTSTTDPRVNRYNNTGADVPLLAISNYLLATSKTITEITSIFISDKFVDYTASTIEGLFKSDIYEAFKGFILGLTSIFGIAIVIYIVKCCIRVSIGRASFREQFINIIGSILTVALVTILVTNPIPFVEISKKVLTFGDNLVAIAFNQTDNEIIHSDDTSNVIEATIWYQSVFQPWCEGTFGTTYDKLYTEYAEVDDSKKLQQGDGSRRATGDIFVPTGANQVRNWAALAYSCQTYYHLDALGEYDEVGSDEEIDMWPKAAMTSNKSIYNDDFRWIDAMLNVGNKEAGDKTAGYEDYNSYQFRGITSGLYSVWMSLLLLPLLYLGLKKTICVIKILGNVIVLLYRSCLNILQPENQNYGILQNIKAMVTPIRDYFWFIIMIMVVMFLYVNVASNGMPAQILYIAMSIYLCLSMPDNLKNQMQGVKRIATNTVLSTRSAIKDLKNSNPKDYKNKNIGSLKGNALRNDPNKLNEDQEDLRDKRDELSEEDKYLYDHNFRSSFGVVTAETYENAEKEAMHHNTKSGQNANVRREYEQLWRRIRCARRNRDVYEELKKWRDSKEPIKVIQGSGEKTITKGELHREWDRDILKIPYSDQVSNDLDNHERNPFYDAYAEREAELDKNGRREVGHSAKGYADIKDRWKKISDQYENGIIDKKEYKAEYRKAMKQMKKDDKKARYDALETTIANITGDCKMNSLVGLQMKMKIVKYALIAWVIGVIPFYIFGC